MQLWPFLDFSRTGPPRPRLATTFDEGRTAPLGRLGPAWAEAAKKGGPIPARTRRTLIEVEGRGILRRLCFTFLALGRARLRRLRLRIAWDGDSEPSVDVPLGDFFLQPFGGGCDVDTFPVVVNAGALVAFFPMPFERGFRLEIENAGDRLCPAFFAQASWDEVPGEVPPERFHACWRREEPATGVPLTFLEVAGEGHFVGASVQSQNLELWMLQRPSRWLMPSGLGLGQLEGWETLEVDGELAHHGLAQEDWAGGGWYFKRAPAPASRHGVTARSYLSGRCAFYRFYLEDALPFRRSFVGRFEHGLLNRVRTDYAVTSFYYRKGAQGAGSSEGPLAPRSRLFARTVPPT